MKRQTVINQIARSTVDLKISKGTAIEDLSPSAIEYEVSSFVGEMNGNKRYELEDYIASYIAKMKEYYKFHSVEND